MQFVRLVLAWLVTALYSMPVILFSALTLRRFTDTVLPPSARLWSLLVLKLLGIRLEIEGLELMRERRPRIVIFNHESTLDILWLARIFPPAALGIVKREFIYIPVFNLALWSSNFVFIDRSNRQRAMSTLQALAARIIRERRSLLIAPEGTRTRNGELLPFKKGAFRIAAGAGIPLYPVVAAGGYALQPKPRIVPKKGTIKVACLAPIETQDWDMGQIDRKIAEIHALMRSKRDELRAALGQ